MACSKGTDFGRREQKVSRVGAAATSSVRSFQSLIALGGKGEFPVVSTTLDRWALGVTGNGNDGLLWYWDSHLVFTWCQWLWSHGDGGTYKSSPVLLSCTYVGNMVSLVLSLDILQYFCGVHHTAFCCTDSRRLISLMLFGCQIELAYSRTGVTTALYL